MVMVSATGSWAKLFGKATYLSCYFVGSNFAKNSIVMPLSGGLVVVPAPTDMLVTNGIGVATQQLENGLTRVKVFNDWPHDGNAESFKRALGLIK